MSKPVPVDSRRTDWPRLVANAINDLQGVKVGETRYNGTALQYWDGTDWVDVP